MRRKVKIKMKDKNARKRDMTGNLKKWKGRSLCGSKSKNGGGMRENKIRIIEDGEERKTEGEKGEKKE